MAARLLDVAFAGLLFGVSIFLWFAADEFPTSQRFARADADFWPKIIFGAMALITGVMAARGLVGLRERSPADEPVLAPASERWRSAGRVAAMGGLILAAFFAFQHVGYVLSTFAFLLLASYVIPYRGHLVRIVFAAGFTALLVLFFTKALGLPLPRGTGAFYDVNVLLY